MINLNVLPIEIDDFYEIPREFYENTSIVELSKVMVKGLIKYNLSDEVEVNLEVSGVMKLNDSVTNELIDYPFSLKIEENLQEIDGNCENTLDIIEFLWENIVLEVPIAVTNSSGAKLSGDGWCLNREDNNINPEFAKLSELIKGGEKNGSSF